MSNAAKFKKRAADFESQKQFDKAIASYVRAIEAGDVEGGEVDVALLNKVGDLTLRLGRVAEAVTSYERAVEHYSAVGLFNNAIALCNKILRHAPGRVGVYLTLGRVCARKGMRGDATRNFLEYAARMQKEGRTDDAMQSLAEVAGLMPELTEVRRLVEEHAARVGIALPAVTEGAAQTGEHAAPKADALVFLDIDYDASLTPPRGSGPIDPQPEVAPPTAGGRENTPSSTARTNSLDDLLIFDPSDDDVDIDYAEPLDGFEANAPELTLQVGEEQGVAAELSLITSSADSGREAIPEVPEGLTDALGYAPQTSDELPVAEVLDGFVPESEDGLLLDVASLDAHDIDTSHAAVQDVVWLEVDEAEFTSDVSYAGADGDDLRHTPQVVDEVVLGSTDQPVVLDFDAMELGGEAEELTEPLLPDAEDEDAHSTEHFAVEVSADLSEAVEAPAKGNGESQVDAVVDVFDHVSADVSDDVSVDDADDASATVEVQYSAEWEPEPEVHSELEQSMAPEAVEASESESQMEATEVVAAESAAAADEPTSDLIWLAEIEDLAVELPVSDVSEVGDVDAATIAADQVVAVAVVAEAPGTHALVTDEDVTEDHITEDHVTAEAITEDFGAETSLIDDIVVEDVVVEDVVSDDRSADDEHIDAVAAIILDGEQTLTDVESIDSEVRDDASVTAAALEIDVEERYEEESEWAEHSSLAMADILHESSAATAEPARYDWRESAPRLDPHDFILPGELPPIIIPDSLLRGRNASAWAGPDESSLPEPATPFEALEDEPASEQPTTPEIEPTRARIDEGVLDLDAGELVPASETQVLDTDDTLHLDTDDVLDLDTDDEIDIDDFATAELAEPSMDSSTELDALLTPQTPAVAMNLALDRCARLREEADAHPGDWARRRRLAEALLEAGEVVAGLDELAAISLGLEVEGEYEQAARVSDDIVRVAPDAIPHHLKRVELAVRLGDRDRLRESYLDMADALVRTGMGSRAESVYVRVLELDPWDDRARAALGDAAPPPPARPPQVAPADDGYVNLADWLSDDSGQPDTRMRLREPTVTGDEDADFDRLLQHFREGVSRSLGDDDYESHYDLGVAYKEMGLLDDAIAEFQRALRSPTHRLPAYEALGQCFLEQGSFPVAVTVLSRALHEPGLDDEQRVGVLYLLGYACEALQRRDEARSYFQRVYATDIHFRDVADRLAALDRGV